MAEYSGVHFKDKKMRKFLSNLEKNFRNAKDRQRAFVVNLGAIVFQDVMDHFDKEEGPDGKWSDFSRSYKAAVNGEMFFRRIGGKTIPFKGEDPNGRPKKGSLGQMLVSSNTMRNWFAPAKTGQRSRKVSNGIMWFNAAKTKKGFPYAKHHDEGPSDGKKPRSFMWLSDKAMERITETSLRFILKGK